MGGYPVEPKEANVGKNKDLSKTGLSRKAEIKLVRECYDNFPEASESLTPRRWKYATFDFEFFDTEDGKTHRVRLLDALRGLKLFVKEVRAGKLPGLGLSTNFLSDTGEWDASAFDALNQPVVALHSPVANPATGPAVATYAVRDTNVAGLVPVGTRAATVSARKTGSTWIVGTRGTLADSLALVVR